MITRNIIKIFIGIIISTNLYCAQSLATAGSANYQVDYNRLSTIGTISGSTNYSLNQNLTSIGSKAGSINYEVENVYYAQTTQPPPTQETPPTQSTGNSGRYIKPICGNGKIETGEQCDDGNTYTGDGCDSLCQFDWGKPNEELMFNITLLPNTWPTIESAEEIVESQTKELIEEKSPIFSGELVPMEIEKNTLEPFLRSAAPLLFKIPTSECKTYDIFLFIIILIVLHIINIGLMLYMLLLQKKYKKK